MILFLCFFWFMLTNDESWKKFLIRAENTYLVRSETGWKRKFRKWNYKNCFRVVHEVLSSTIPHKKEYSTSHAGGGPQIRFLHHFCMSHTYCKNTFERLRLSQGNVASYGSSFWLISKCPRQDLFALVMRIEHHHPENTVKKSPLEKRKEKRKI